MESHLLWHTMRVWAGLHVCSELHVEDMATADDLEHTLNPFYIAHKELFMRAQDPMVSFTELL